LLVARLTAAGRGRGYPIELMRPNTRRNRPIHVKSRAGAMIRAGARWPSTGLGRVGYGL